MVTNKSPLSKVSYLKINSVVPSDYGRYECRVITGFQMYSHNFNVLNVKGMFISLCLKFLSIFPN